MPNALIDTIATVERNDLFASTPQDQSRSRHYGFLRLRIHQPQTILPGQFVRLVIKGITLPKASVIPQQAVSQGPQGTFVYVVKASSAAEVRPVKLDREVGAGWLVRDGLNEGDRIIADGVMRVRPGAPVKASQSSRLRSQPPCWRCRHIQA